MPLLLMESETDCETNCSQKLLHVARTVGIFFAKLLQLLLQTRSLAKHAFTLWLTTALHCSYILHDAIQSRRPSALSWNESTL